ncbi:ras-related protein Rab-27B-like [Entamoeba marina]
MNLDFQGIEIGITGCWSTGKTSFCVREVENIFKNRHDIIIGSDFKNKVFNIDRTQIQTRIWELRNPENNINFELLTTKIKHFIVLYDVNNSLSFGWACSIIPKIKNAANDVVIILVGNKTDVGQREVTIAEALGISNELGCYKYYEISLLHKAQTDIITELLIDALEKKNEILKHEDQRLQHQNEEQQTKACMVQ